MKHMRSYMRAIGVAFFAPFLGVLGCGDVSSEAENLQASIDEDAEVSRTEQALGSSMARVDVSTWNGLVAMIPDGNYRLTADINASGRTWTPKDFRGTFDGNGRTISNLTINVNDTAGFFRTISQAIVKNVRFVNLNVTGNGLAGGVAGFSVGSQVERIAVEGTITGNNGVSVGGIFGEMAGGTLFRSYAKGTVQGSRRYAGGLVGYMGWGDNARPVITESYAQVTVSPDTSDPARIVISGGIAGRVFGGDIHDVYAVGNVTGRGTVGGLVGYLDCNDSSVWLLYKGIYRGDVIDRNAPAGGWAGTIGGYKNCTARFSNLFWDSTLDPSSNWLSNPVVDLAQTRATTTQLRSPTTPIGGVYCAPDVVPGRCGDNNFQSPPWDAGTSSQHHALLNMPGPNVQPR